MKLAGILFLIATIVYFLIKWKKAGNKSGKSEINKTSAEKGDEKKKTDDNASSAGYWKKNRRSLIVWIIILQFIVLNLIYPGEWFEVKKIFWFFAPRISGKYLALKEYKDIVETDKKKKLSDIQEKIRKFEKVKELSTADIKKLNELTKQAEKINDIYSETETAKPASAKPKEKVIITKPVSNDLLTGAYLSWQKPDDYAGKKPEIREAVFGIKITRLDNEKLVFLDSNGKDTTDCTWKEESKKYQGQWEKDGKVGFIEFTPIYKNGKIVSLCGAMGSKNKKPNSFCWITGGIP